MKLRAYQEQAIQHAREAIGRGKRAPLLVAPTGAGKTIVISEIVRLHLALHPDNRVLVIAHRTELLGQIAGALVKLGTTSIGVISPNDRPRPTARVQVASTQTLRAQNRFPQATLLIADECVTGDTVVGGKLAKDVQVGDLVDCWDGASVVQRRVTHRFANKRSGPLVRICAGGRVLDCTENHPIFVEGKGYVDASKIILGDVCYLWERHSEPASRSLDMQPGVLEQNAQLEDVGHKPKARVCQDEAEKPYAQCEVKREILSNFEENWAQAKNTGREREAHPEGPVQTVGNFAHAAKYGALDARVCGENRQGKRVAAWSESGHCSTMGNDSYRNRRCEPLQLESERRGPSQTGIFRKARVDSVQVLKRGSGEQSAAVREEDVVFNFEVEELHNFFANGILTHNCHHYASDDWSLLVEGYRDVIRIGVTATPMRADGRGLGEAFDELIVVTSVRELTALGVLVPCRILHPSPPLKRPALAWRPVEAYQKYAEGKLTVVFADSIGSAEAFHEEFKEAGIPSAVVHGKLSAAERARALKAHDDGAVLINCQVLTEGWDSPKTSCCILARGCGSVGTYIQIVGRILRSHPGKTEALLIDLTGRSVEQHGGPEDERIFSLDGKGIRRKDEAGIVKCPVCGGDCEPSPNSFPCPQCGYKPPGNAQEAPEYLGVELVERYASKRREDLEKRIDSLAHWIAQASWKGWKPGYALAKYRAVYGTPPPQEVLDQAKRTATLIDRKVCKSCEATVPRLYDGQCWKCKEQGK